MLRLKSNVCAMHTHIALPDALGSMSEEPVERTLEVEDAEGGGLGGWRRRSPGKGCLQVTQPFHSGHTAAGATTHNKANKLSQHAAGNTN